MQQAIVKGVNIKNLGLAVGVLVFGVGLVLAGIFADYTLAIGSVALPSWTIHALGGVAIVVGALLTVMALRAEKCGSCGAPLEYGEAYFPLEHEQIVMQAVSSLDGATLGQLPMVPKNQMKMALELSYCDKCGQVGQLSVTKWQGSQPYELLKDQIVTGPQVRSVADVVEAHKEARGEDDD